MSTAWTASFMARMLRVICDYCGAKPGEPCRSKGGHQAKPHTPRQDAAARQA